MRRLAVRWRDAECACVGEAGDFVTAAPKKRLDA
jgi:hypothetical protein